MAKKVEIQDDQDPSEDPAVVAKVDEMMDPAKEKDKPSESEQPTPQPEAESVEEPTSDLPPLDIFADAPGAPQLESKDNKSKKKEEKKKEEVETADKAEEINTEDNAEVPLSSDDIDNSPVEANPIEPDDFDDPTTAKAIDDIVAHESDVVLGVADDKLAKQEEQEQPVKEEKASHKLFWSLVFIVCIIAIAMALYIIDPSIHSPIKGFNWGTIKRHL